MPFFYINCCAQKNVAVDKLLLLNGSEITCIITDTSEIAVKYKLKPDSKEFSIEKYRMFSYIYGNTGEEYIVYTTDTLNGNDFSQHEMRMFLYGEADAKKNYKIPVLFATSILIGAASAVFIPLIIVAPLVPAVFVLYAGSRFVKIDRKKIDNKFYLSEDSYVIGYERAGRIKNVQKTILGSAIGLVSGYAVYKLAIEPQ